MSEQRKSTYTFGTDRYVPNPCASKTYYRKDPTKRNPLTDCPESWKCKVDADPRLEAMIKAASKFLPPGWQVTNKGSVNEPHERLREVEFKPWPTRAKSNARPATLLRAVPGNKAHHPRGRAIDIALINENNMLMPNIRSAKYFRVYELFAQIVVKCIKEGLVVKDNGDAYDWSDLVRGGTGHSRGPTNDQGDALGSEYQRGGDGAGVPNNGVCLRWLGYLHSGNITGDAMHFDFGGGGDFDGGSFLNGASEEVRRWLRNYGKREGIPEKNELGQLLPVSVGVQNWGTFLLPQSAEESAARFREALGLRPIEVAQVDPPTPPIETPAVVLPPPPAVKVLPAPPAVEATPPPPPPAEVVPAPTPAPVPPPEEPAKPEITPPAEVEPEGELLLAVRKYKKQIEELKKMGWNLYTKDLTSFDLFYKENTLIIPTSSNPDMKFNRSGTSIDNVYTSNHLFCDFISATSFNVFKKLPIQGISMPTAQFLGRADNSFLVSFKSLGLDSVRQIEVIKDTLKKQAIQYKFIPESYVLRVENNFINAMGDLYFVINGLDSATLPETPGTYATEMRLTANDIYIKNPKIKRQSLVSSKDIKRTFIDELLSRTSVEYGVDRQIDTPIITNVDCISDNCAPTPITATDANVPTIDLSSPGLDVIRDQLFLYWNTTRSVWYNDTIQGLGEGHKAFMQKICGTINLCNRLIIPNGHRLVDSAYRLKIPEGKEIIDLFYRKGTGFLHSTLLYDQPYLWLKDYTQKYEGEFLQGGMGTVFGQQFSFFQLFAPIALDPIAPAYWDFKLEFEHTEYDLSELPLRIEAFTFADGEGQSSYADALNDWSLSGDITTNPIAPYIRSHRSVLALARNTWFLWMWRVSLLQEAGTGNSALGDAASLIEGTPRVLIEYFDSNENKTNTAIRENWNYVRRFAPNEIFQEEVFGPNFLRGLSTSAKEYGVNIFELVKPITSLETLMFPQDDIGGGFKDGDDVSTSNPYTIMKPGAKMLFKPWKGFDVKDMILDIALVWGGEFVVAKIGSGVVKVGSFIIGKGKAAAKAGAVVAANTKAGSTVTHTAGAVAAWWKTSGFVVACTQKLSAFRHWLLWNTQSARSFIRSGDILIKNAAGAIKNAAGGTPGVIGAPGKLFTGKGAATGRIRDRVAAQDALIAAGKKPIRGPVDPGMRSVQFVSGKQTLITGASIAGEDLTDLFNNIATTGQLNDELAEKRINNSVGGFGINSANAQLAVESFFYDFHNRRINGGNPNYDQDSVVLNNKDTELFKEAAGYVNKKGPGAPLMLKNKKGYKGGRRVVDFVTEFEEIIDNPGSNGWMKLTVPNQYFMDYAWNYLIIPYLNNVFDFENIYKISTETEFFPKTRELLIAQEQSLVEPAYEDLDLPLHPYWNQRVSALGFDAVVNNFYQNQDMPDNQVIANFSRGNSFTEPDFYLYNPSIDGNDELLADRQIEKTKLSARWSAEDIYNFNINMSANLAAGDIERLGKTGSPLNADLRAGTTATRKDFIAKFKEKANNAASDLMEGVIGAWNNEIHDTQVVPKQTPNLDNDDKVGDDGDSLTYPKAKSSKDDWANLSLWLGPNQDLLAPMSMNFNKDDEENQKLRMSTLANVTLQDFNRVKGEDYILRMQEYLRGDYEDFLETIKRPEAGETGQGAVGPDGSEQPTPENLCVPPRIGTAERPRARFGQEEENNQSRTPPNFNLYNFFDDDCGAGDPSVLLQFSTQKYANLTRLHDGLKSIGRKKLAARRAYPVCKVYLIEEDDIYNTEYVELDEIYTYSKIERLEIADSRKRPSSICRLTFVDPNGVLTGFNQFAKAANSILISDDKVTERLANVGTGLEFESSNALVRGTEFEQSDIGFVLNAGMKIKVCLGFSNDANKLEEVFLGEITDINLDGSGNKIEVVAQSYGAELVAKLKGTTKKETSVQHLDTFDLLARLMFEPEVIHFGKKKFDSIISFGEDKSIAASNLAYKEGFAVGGMHNARRKGGFINYLYTFEDSFDLNWIDGTYDALENWKNDANKAYVIKPNQGPQDDNLYIPSYQPLQGYYWYDWFGTWTGALTRDGTARVVQVEDGQVKEFEDKAKKLGIPAAAGWTAGAIALPTAWKVGSAAGNITKTKIGLIVAGAVAFGVVLKVVIQAMATAAYYTADYFLTDKDAVEKELQGARNHGTGILDRHALAKKNANDSEYKNSPMLISVYSPETLYYNVFYSTIWDVFEEMTYRHPSYVKHPRIYKNSNRMTMFFGLPDQNMWEYCGDPLDVYRQNKIFRKILKSGGQLEEGSPFLQQTRRDASGDYTLPDYGNVPSVSSEEIANFIRIARRRFRPFRTWHNLNSYTDIISNDIEATADGWYTEVEVQWNDAAIRTASAPDVRNLNAFIDWQEQNTVTRKANVDLSPQFIRKTSYQFPNCKSKGMASTYARSILAKQAKEMYKGSMTIMGNPHIKPYDVCIINDTYNNIYGPIEVEEVHHIFSPETGYITQLYPDTFVIEEDVTPYIIFNGLQSSVYTRTQYYMELALAAFPNWGEKNNMTSEGQYYLDSLSEVMENYRQKVLKMQEEVNAAQDFTENISIGAGTLGVISGGALALSTKRFMYGGGALGSTASVLLGSAIAGSLAYFYASSSLTSVIYNYIAEGRAYMMIPLAREGIPMVAGTNIGMSTGMYKSPGQYIRQYWMDGGLGQSMTRADSIMKTANARLRYGASMDNTLLEAQFTADDLGFTYDKMFEDIGGTLANKYLFPNVKKQ